MRVFGALSPLLCLTLLAQHAAAEASDEAVAAVGCVAMMDAIYAANEELGQTPKGDPEDVHAEWVDVVQTVAPDLPQAEFDALYAEIYPEVYRTALDFGRERLAGPTDPEALSPAATEFLQVVDLCQRTMRKSMDQGQN